MCGLVAHYNETELPPGPDRSSALMSAILRKSLTVRGFIQNEFADFSDGRVPVPGGRLGAGRFTQVLRGHRHGLENAPDAFIGLLEGKNFGKLIVRVS